MSGISHLLVILIITATLCYGIEDRRDQDISPTELKKEFEENKDILQKYSAEKLLSSLFRRYHILKAMDSYQKSKKIQNADFDNYHKFTSSKSKRYRQRLNDRLRVRQELPVIFG